MGLFKKSHSKDPIVQHDTTSSTSTTGASYGNSTLPGSEPYSSHPPGTHPTTTTGAHGHGTSATTGTNHDPRTTGQKVKDAFTPGDQGAQYRNDGTTGTGSHTGTHGHGTTTTTGTHSGSHDYAHGANTDPRTTGQKVKDAVTPGDQGAQYRNDGTAGAGYANNDPSYSSHHQQNGATGASHYQQPQYAGAGAGTGAVDNRTTGQKLKEGLTGSHNKDPAHHQGAAPGYTNDPYYSSAGSHGTQGSHSGVPGNTGHSDPTHHSSSTSSGGGLFNRNSNNNKSDDIDEILRQEAQAKKDMEDAIARHNAAHQNAGSRLQSQEEAARAEYEQAERRLREAEAFRKQHGH